MTYLTLKDINKIYPNGFHAVHDFNLEIKKGEFIVFVGPSEKIFLRTFLIQTKTRSNPR